MCAGGSACNLSPPEAVRAICEAPVQFRGFAFRGGRMRNIRRYMVDQIAVAKYTGQQNLDGTPTYLPVEIIPARIQYMAGIVRHNDDGEYVNANSWIACMDYAVQQLDLVWLAPEALDGPRVFPAGYDFDFAKARTPFTTNSARRRFGESGHCEFYL